MRLLLPLFLFFISTASFALEIDEKLTLRILDVSSSKKTILINRGIEDGLVVGDHAKFFKTTGVIARGVVLKVSPTRSIWSLYRLIEDDSVVKNRVLSLKISAPVKVTKDPSRAIKEEEATSTGIIVAEGADDLPKDLSKSEQEDLSSLSDDEGSSSSVDSSGIDKDSLWQVFAYGSYNTFTTTVTEGTTEGTANTTSMTVGAGVEKYFSGVGSFMDRFSLQVFAEKTMSASHDIDTFDASQVTLFGGGVGIHFINSPLSYGRFIPYLTANGGMGQTSTTYSSVASNGSVTFWNAGAGLKYNFKNGFGVRGAALFSYRNETYSFEGGSIDQLTVAHSGFGASFGVSYRF